MDRYFGRYFVDYSTLYEEYQVVDRMGFKIIGRFSEKPWI